MSREEMKEIIIDLRKTHRTQPLGYGKILEDGFNRLIELLESELEPTENYPDESEEFLKWWRSGICHYSTFGGYEKSVAVFAWNYQQKKIDRLKEKTNV